FTWLGHGARPRRSHVKYLFAHLEQMRARAKNEMAFAANDEAQVSTPHRVGNTGHASVDYEHGFRLRRCFNLLHRLRKDTAVDEHQRSRLCALQYSIGAVHA